MRTGIVRTFIKRIGAVSQFSRAGAIAGALTCSTAVISAALAQQTTSGDAGGLDKTRTASLESRVAEFAHGDPYTLGADKAMLGKLAVQLDVPAALITDFLAKLDRGVVPLDHWQGDLATTADNYAVFSQQIRNLDASGSKVGALVDKASQAAERVDFEAANQLLEKADGLETRADRLSHARFTLARAQTMVLAFKYAEAAQLFDKAAVLASGADNSFRHRATLMAIKAYYQGGDIKSLHQAMTHIEAIRNAGVRTLSPIEWAKSIQQLLVVWVKLSEVEGDGYGLEIAASNYRTLLDDDIPNQPPTFRLENQLGLARALEGLGESESGTEHLEDAIAAFRVALEEQPRETEPIGWAGTQNDLGHALSMLAAREEGTTHLVAAIAAFRQALRVRTRQSMLTDWAATESQLGASNALLGERDGNPAELDQAIIALQMTLEVYTHERTPLGWASIKSSLGEALGARGVLENGTARLEEAIACDRAALGELRHGGAKRDLARTEANLGKALKVLGLRQASHAHFEEAVIAFRAALDGTDRSQMPRDWAAIETNLGFVLEALVNDKNDKDDIERLRDAVVAFQSALSIRIRLGTPLDWGLAEANLAGALKMLATREQGTARLEEAVAAYGVALEEFNRADATLYSGEISRDLDAARAALPRKKQ